MSLPPELETALQALHFRGRTPRRELLTAYHQEPARIAGWIESLAATRAQDPHAAGFLLKVVVREGAPLPISAPAAPAAPCTFCNATGYIQLAVPPTDPDYGIQFPCPRCQHSSPKEAP